MNQKQADLMFGTVEQEQKGFIRIPKGLRAPEPNERGAWVKSNSPWVEVVEPYNCYRFHKWDADMPSLEAWKAYVKAETKTVKKQKK